MNDSYEERRKIRRKMFTESSHCVWKAQKLCTPGVLKSAVFPYYCRKKIPDSHTIG